jgi:hypothetical protein
MKNQIKTLLFITISAILFTSCDEGGDPDAGGTTTKNFAGDWHIIVLEADGETPLSNYGLFTTYNAASNDDFFWLDDHEHIFDLKTKVKVSDFDKLTFSAANSEEIYAGDNVNITNGKILKNAAHSIGGHVVDSIYFEVEYVDDPGTIYKFAGHKRTGFLEDEL